MPVFEFFRLTQGSRQRRRFCETLAAAGINSGFPGSAIRLRSARLPHRGNSACCRGTRRDGRSLRRRICRAPIWLLVRCRRSHRLFSANLRRRREPAAGRRLALAGADRCPASGDGGRRDPRSPRRPPQDAGKTRVQIHVSTDDPLDLLHARRIAGRGGVEIFEHERGGHLLVKTLRDRGLLQPMLLEALSAQPADPDPSTTLGD